MRLTLARRRDVGGSSEQSSRPRWSSAVALQGSQEEEEDRARDALLAADPGLLSLEKNRNKGAQVWPVGGQGMGRELGLSLA